MTERFAIYFAPRADSLLWQLGCLWLGRDLATGARPQAPLPQGLSQGRHAQIVRSPRHYGFHATLKPPFALAPGGGSADLAAGVAGFAQAQTRFAVPALEVSRIGGFLALTLGGPSPAMDLLAAECVTRFDSYRAPPSPKELAGRRKLGLSARQEALLGAWGYPYVLDEWRFHMTLTASLADPEITFLETHLRRFFRDVLAHPIMIDRIALFRQPDRDMPFEIAEWFQLGGNR